MLIYIVRTLVLVQCNHVHLPRQPSGSTKALLPGTPLDDSTTVITLTDFYGLQDRVSNCV